MTTAVTPFFALEPNRLVIQNFATTLRAIEPLSPPNPEVVQPLRRFFHVLLANAEAFDQFCSANIAWIGPQYILQLSNFVSQREKNWQDQLLDIFTSSYRFLCELDFTQPGDLSMDLRTMKNFVDQHLEAFAPLLRQQLVYANYIMPAHVAKNLIHDPSLVHFKRFTDVAAAAKTLKETWDKELEEKKIELDALREVVNRLKTQYNFVGLVKGFETLAGEKVLERRRTFIALIIIGCLLLVPVGTQLYFLLQHMTEVETYKNILAYTAPAILTVEIILIYYFRVVLQQYRGLQTQLLQLGLRISLCQFIQSYAEYSAKIKKNDPKALDRFESVVFSSVVPESDKLPATFDGAEQLAKLVKSVRGE